MGTDTTMRLANALAEMRLKGEAVTVRSLKAKAQCSTDAARECLAEHQRTAEIASNLTMPDLSDVTKMLWAHAVAAAVEDVKHVADQRIEEAELGEAEALDRSIHSEAQLKRNSEEMDRTRAEIERVNNENVQMRRDRDDERARHEKELDRLREEVKAERTRADEANTRAVSAEATVSTLNSLISDLKPAPAEKATISTKANGQTTRTAK